MMKVTYTPRPNIVVEFEADGQKGLFEVMHQLQEIFSETQCGKPLCQSNKLQFVVREVDDNKFYELRCKKCGASLAFGCHKKHGTIFPQRKDKDGNRLPDGGWTKWNPATEQRE